MILELKIKLTFDRIKRFFSHKHSPYEFDHFSTLKNIKQSFISICALKYTFFSQECIKKQENSDFRAKIRTNLSLDPRLPPTCYEILTVKMPRPLTSSKLTIRGPNKKLCLF